MRLSYFLLPATLVAATCGDQQSLNGRIEPSQAADWIYVPFEVKPGVTSIRVDYSYANQDVNVLDIGLFDERGHTLAHEANGTTGFRGFSFNYFDTFTLTPGWTTPNYISGPIAHGTWSLLLGPRTVEEGGFEWNATVTFGYKPASERFSPYFAPTDLGLDEKRSARLDEDGEVWLRGDFHVHSTYSDGKYLPEEQVANAKKQDLDFFYFTEHNQHSGNDVFGVWAPNDMLVGRGMEVTTRSGHWQAVGLERGQTIEWRYGPNNTGYAAAAEEVRRSGGFVSVNHPYMACKECLWNLDHDYEHNDAMEVWNGGITEALNEQALALWQSLLVKGSRMTAIGGSDTHNPPSMIGKPTTYVKGRTLSSASIVEGVKRRRSYTVDSPEMEINFTVQGDGVHAQVGDIVKTGKPALEARLVTVGMNGLQASWVSESGYLHNETVIDGSANVFELDQEHEFLRVEIRNSNGTLMGFTNPIYFES